MIALPQLVADLGIAASGRWRLAPIVLSRGSAWLLGVITSGLRLREAQPRFGQRRLTLQLAHAHRGGDPGAVGSGLVEVIPLACVPGLGRELLQAGSGPPWVRWISHRVCT
jgi:hypothetical protein